MKCTTRRLTVYSVLFTLVSVTIFNIARPVSAVQHTLVTKFRRPPVNENPCVPQTQASRHSLEIHPDLEADSPHDAQIIHAEARLHTDQALHTEEGVLCPFHPVSASFWGNFVS